MQTRQRLQFLLSIYDTFCLCRPASLTLCGSTFFYLQHILTPSEGLELFEASDPSGFCISVTIKLGM